MVELGEVSLFVSTATKMPYLLLFPVLMVYEKGLRRCGCLTERILTNGEFLDCQKSSSVKVMHHVQAESN